ncbi:MAG: class I adenylate-forming enzyme family protein [Burkholderiaceae bacterium]
MQKPIEAHWLDPRYPRDIAERCRQIEAEPLPPSTAALLDEAADEVPRQLALQFIDSGEQLDYAELRQCVNRFAAGLFAAGVRKGTRVAVMLPNVPQFPISWLALGRLGAVMVPANTGYTGRELGYLVNDAQVHYLIIADAYRDVLDSMNDRPAQLSQDRVIVLGEPAAGQLSWQTLHDAGDPAFQAPEPVGLDDLCNIQYTSGTTGFPKGCLLTHRYWTSIGKVNSARDGLRYERILTATPFYYMDPQWLLLMTFYQRATLFMAARQSASRFSTWLSRYRIHFCQLPAEAAFKQPPTPFDADNEVRRANVYGMRGQIHAEVEQRFNLNAREAFGMTEIGSTLFVPLEAEHMIGSGSCGIPGPFREVRIVNGELQVRGPGILLGYYNRPDATREAFDDGWFRTGDLFHQDENGWYYIVGRLKDMVRRASENIPAREVESVLRAMPEIADVAVVPVPDEMRKEEVKVYVILEPGLSASDVPPERIIAHARLHLAQFKVPRYVEYCDEFPRTPSGKVRKQEMIAAKADLRSGSWDRVDGIWR